MIVHRKNWKQVGVEVTTQDVENRIKDVLRDIDCRNLALSGGLDSSLLLYFMCQMYDPISVFTIGKTEYHPDVVFAKKVVECYQERFNVRIKHYIYYPRNEEIEGHIERYDGDRVVKLFYQFVSKHTSRIIAGDGIDEFMCGYYAHMERPREEIYYYFLRRLQDEQLIPLNENSGEMRVCLPYIDRRIIILLSQISLEDKVDGENRKKFMVKMAKGKIPKEVIERRKYGFCDVLVEEK